MGDAKRILHIWNSMNIGGIETFIMNLYRNIDREKIQFDFLLTSYDKSDYEDEILALGGKIHRISGKKKNYFKHLKELNKILKNNPQYNVVHCHTPNNINITNILAAKKHGANKIIYHSHNNKSIRPLLNELFNFMYKPRVKNYATHYFACSELAATHLFGKYIDSSEIKIINNAIDTGKFVYNLSVRQKLRNEFDIAEKFVIGHVGRFSTQKNHTFLLDIFSEVHKKNNDAILMLIGEGELRNDIEKKIAALGLSDSVILAGVRPDVNELMQAIDLFLFPSLHEGLGIVLIEAQASGLHSITSAGVVPQLAKVTDLLEYISLKSPASYWAEQVLRYSNGYERKNMQEDIKKASFDITELAKWFEEFYLS